MKKNNFKSIFTYVIVLTMYFTFFPVDGYTQDKAPDFEIEDINGGKLKLSDYKGKIVILDFWDTWCPPCKKEIPDFIELYKAYKDNVVIIGAAFAQRGKDAVKKFYKEYKINYPVGIATMDLAKEYGGIRGIPTTFVIDSDGKIFKKYVGFREKAVFENDIKDLLKKRS